MAKKNSGATEVNGFISVRNDKTDLKKSTIRKVGNKDSTEGKKSLIKTDKDNKYKLVKENEPIKKVSTTQNEVEKRKTNIIKKPTEIITGGKTQISDSKGTVRKFGADTKYVSSTSNKNQVNTVPNKTINKEKTATSTTTTKNITKLEPKKVTNIGPKKFTNNSETKKITNIENNKTTNVGLKKTTDIKQLVKSKVPVDKDLPKKYQVVKEIPKKVSTRSTNKSNVEISKENAQRKVKTPITSTNTVRKTIDKSKYTIRNIDAKKTIKKEPVKENIKKNLNAQRPATVSRQGTWVKGSSDKPDLEDSGDGHAEYESDFEEPSSLSISERTEKTLSPQSHIQKSPIDTNRLTSSRGKDVSEHESIEGTELPNSNTLENSINNDEEAKKLPVNAEPEFLQSIEYQSYDQYDDDFEEYESDFEEDTESGLSITSTEESSSTSQSAKTNASNKDVLEGKQSKTSTGSKATFEEERKLDSGNYDLATKMVLSEAVKQRQLDEIREAVSRENTIYKERNVNLEESEGDKDSSSKLKIINFKEASQRIELNKNRERIKHRGEQILSMITLHPIQYNIFEMVPITYDSFIKIYGRLNFLQANTQTGDVEEEDVQTVEINIENKWTQHPVEFHRWENTGNDINIYLEDRQGVGGDVCKNHKKWMSNSKYNVNRLTNFIHYAGQIMLVLLEEEEQELNLPLKRTKQSYGFSDGYVQISVENINFLKDRSVSDILFSPHNPNTIITAHRSAKNSGDTFIDQYYARCIICVWSVLEPSQPLKMLVAPCQISAICFDDTFLHLIYAGLTDGTVCLWDISESVDVHQQNMVVDMPVLRSPTYCTYDTNQEIHLSTIISVKSIGYGKSGRSTAPSRLISLSEDGKMIVWTVIQLTEPPLITEKQAMYELGIAYWGRIKLVFSSLLNPLTFLNNSSREKDLSWGVQFLCMVRSIGESVNFLIGSNVGKIVHMHISGSGVEPVSVFKSSSEEQTAVTCIELCPHEFQLFLAGCDDGTIRMYKIDRSLPLRVYSCQKDDFGEPISRIKWSIMKPALFLIMDKNSNIHIYDLCYGDLSPHMTIPLKKYKASQLDMTKDKNFSYVAFILKRNILQVHKLKPQFIYKKTLPIYKEFQLFDLYVKKLC